MDSEIGTLGRLGIEGLDELDRFLSIREDEQITFDAMFLKRLACQPGIGGVILYKKN